MEKRLRLCSSFAGVDCDYSDTLPITGFCSARSSDISEESFGLLRCCCLVTQSCPTLCDLVDCSPAGSSVHEDSPDKNTGVGCHAFLQGIFPSQGSDPGLLQCRRPGFDPWVGKIPWRRAWQPTPVFLSGESSWTEEPGRLQSVGLQRVRHD